MDDGIYARDKADLGHRIASFCVLSGWAIVSFFNDGFGSAVETFLFYLLPTFCIWFPNALSRYKGIILGDGRYIDEPSHPTFLRYAGWFVLVFVPIALMLILSRGHS
jgi:hypothetical protein